MKICTTCQKSKPISEFNKNSTRKDGLQTVCKECNRLRSRQYYSENKVAHQVVIKKRQERVKQESREYVYKYLLDHPCVDCGLSDIRVLEFDHIRGTKVSGVGQMINKGFPVAKIIQEIDKCEVRCRNHHTIKTYERLGGTWHDQFITS